MEETLLNRILLTLSTGLYCTIFFLSNNWYIYSIAQNILLVLLGTIICSLVIILSAYIIFIILKFIVEKFKTKIDLNQWVDHVILILALSLCAILLRNTISPLHLSPKILITLLVVIVVAAGSKITNTTLRKLSVVFLILTVISVSNLTYDVFMAKTPDLAWTTRNKNYNEQVKFTRNPNVYLIITESYPNKKALQIVNNFNNHLFYEKLEELKFTLHHEYYSNYNHTLASLPSLFGMEHHYYSISIDNFDSVGGRYMLEAKTYNPVVDIFRQNNYKIQYILNGGGLVPRGASIDYCSPSPPVYLALETFLSHQDNTKQSIFSSQNPNFMKTLAERFATTSASGNPSFTFIYEGQPGHSPGRGMRGTRSKLNKIFETFRQGYYKKIQNANATLGEIIDLILKNDNDPLIIITGDHGAYGYRIEQDGKNRDVPRNIVALDMFGVLMAIRFPEDYKRQFDYDFKTHVNLFRYVFAYLSDSDKIHETKVEDDSYDYGPVLAIDDARLPLFN